MKRIVLLTAVSAGLAFGVVGCGGTSPWVAKCHTAARAYIQAAKALAASGAPGQSQPQPGLEQSLYDACLKNHGVGQ